MVVDGGDSSCRFFIDICRGRCNGGIKIGCVGDTPSMVVIVVVVVSVVLGGCVCGS